jgi:hypothetical protein
MKNTAAPGPAPESPLLPLVASAPGSASVAGIDMEPLSSLPRDHPAWQRDVLAVSSRVRAILAGLRPVVVRVLTHWDHVIRSVSIGGRYVEVDPSGCYRLR